MPTASFGYYSPADKGTWLQNKAMASYGRGWGKHSGWLLPKSSSKIVLKPGPIDGVAGAENLDKFSFGKRLFSASRPWRLMYKERTRNHSGYFNINVCSIYDSSGVAVPEELDSTPWEHRGETKVPLRSQCLLFKKLVWSARSFPWQPQIQTTLL
jgi:hypothetical protein